jgi:ribokinase
MKIVVFGSINMDLVCRVKRLPAPGETLRGSDFFTTPGGKGANQAVACAQLGSSVAMIGRVGEDEFGTNLRTGMKKSGVDVSGVVLTQGSSGVALITVEESGENSIVIIPGANGQVGMDDLHRLDSTLEGADSLLLQLEIPSEVVQAAAKKAKEHSVRVILDPAPVSALADDLYSMIDIITPNETECAALTGIDVEDTSHVEQAAKLLVKRGVEKVIIKLGARGAYLYDGKESELIPAIPVNSVDTTAAGDAFNGALATALGKGLKLRNAVEFANAAGALSTTRKGAQPSMPTMKEVIQLMMENGRDYDQTKSEW